MDNAGGSVPPRAVIDRVRGYMTRYQVQLGASYDLSVEAGELVEAGRADAAALLHASPDEVFLGPSTTLNLVLLARALGATYAPGDEVIVTDLDHESNIGPWRALTDAGVVIREWKLNRDTLTLEVDDLLPLLSDRTRLVALTHVSNVVGAIHDVAEIARRCHDAGAQVLVDGVAFAPHRRVDVKALDVDYYAVSLYKVYGPHLGVVYGRRELLEQAKGQNHFFIGEDQVPYKFEPGNVPYELCAGLPGILEYLDALDERHFQGSDVGSQSGLANQSTRLGRVFGLMAQHEQALAERLLGFLNERKGVRVLGPALAHHAIRVPTIAFTVDGMRSSEVVHALDQRKLATRFGHFYAYRAIRELDLLDNDGVVRASLVHYNDLDEIDRLVAALDEILPG
jgi:cysteine desulfurase family protein (TIGR01976 family)